MHPRARAAPITATCLLVLISHAASADDAFWHGARSISWNDGISGGKSNWYSEPPPSGSPRNVPRGTAIFAAGAQQTLVHIDHAPTKIDFIRLDNDAPQYVFVISSHKELQITGIGLRNQSATSPQFNVLKDAKLTLKRLARFRSSSNTVFPATIDVFDGGLLRMEGASMGGNAAVFIHSKGRLSFFDDSSAEQMTIDNDRGTIVFAGNSTGDKATIVNEVGGHLSFSSVISPIEIGLLNNEGTLTAGSTELQVRDSFSQSFAGSLKIDISRQAYGRIFVTGPASLAGNLAVHADGSVVPRVYRIFNTRNGVTGTFAKLSFTGRPDLKAHLLYSANFVSLVVETK